MAVALTLQLHDKSKDNKLLSTDRAMILEPIPGKETLATSGMIDNRLFKGECQLRAVMDPQFSLWDIKYNMGILPEPLRQRFTSFKGLYNYASKYFEKRGIRVAKVID